MEEPEIWKILWHSYNPYADDYESELSKMECRYNSLKRKFG